RRSPTRSKDPTPASKDPTPARALACRPKATTDVAPESLTWSVEPSPDDRARIRPVHNGWLAALKIKTTCTSGHGTACPEVDRSKDRQHKGHEPDPGTNFQAYDVFDRLERRERPHAHERDEPGDDCDYEEPAWMAPEPGDDRNRK